MAEAGGGRSGAMAKKIVAELALAEFDRPEALCALTLAVTESVIRYCDSRREAREYLGHFVDLLERGFEPALNAYPTLAETG